MRERKRKEEEEERITMSWSEVERIERLTRLLFDLAQHAEESGLHSVAVQRVFSAEREIKKNNKKREKRKRQRGRETVSMTLFKCV